jgi:hypothetical protein
LRRREEGNPGETGCRAYAARGRRLGTDSTKPTSSRFLPHLRLTQAPAPGAGS